MNASLIIGDEVFRLTVEQMNEFAIFLIDADGKIASWNRGAARIFGWQDDQIVGSEFGIIFRAEDREAGAPERELTVARETGRSADNRWHRRNDGGLFFADGVTTALKDAGGALIGYSKIISDATERVLAERRMAAQLAINRLLAMDAPFVTTAHDVLETVCVQLDWDVGALWSVDEPGGRIRQLDAWWGDDVDPAISSLLHSKAEMRRGEGLPGRVWESSEPAWITDVRRDPNFPRAPVMHRIGMLSAFAFPLISADRVIGAMEFFNRDERAPEPALLQVMALIGAQVGDYFERRRTAEALRLSERRFRVITESAQDAIFTIDANSTVLFANAGVERLFGYEPEDVAGRPLEIIIPERYRARHQQGIERYLRTGERRIPWSGYEITGLHRDGHEFPIELAFGEFEGPSGKMFSGFARDITERTRAREELRRALETEQAARAEAEAAQAQLERRAEEEVAFRQLASALTGAIERADVMHEITSRATIVARADGVYIERIVSPQEVEVVSAHGRGTPDRGLRVPFPGSLTEQVLNARVPVRLEGLTGFGAAMAPHLRDRCGDCEVVVTPLFSEDEALGALVLLNSRGSQPVFGPDEIQRAGMLGNLASLALRRVRLMEEEREAKVRAETAVRLRDEILGIVSHDLRAPLTSISLAAQLLSARAADEQAEQIEMIETGTRQMERLISDLLDVARLETGRLSVRKERLDAAEIGRLACESNEPLVGERRVVLACDVAESMTVCGDRDRLLQVFGNLLGNAMKFTPEGGTITLRGFERGADVVFEVEDTGPGIPESDLKNVFVAHWQAKKTAHLGAGLGLAIVRGIVEAHGGKVSVENVPGGGAKFSFTIPRLNS